MPRKKIPPCSVYKGRLFATFVDMLTRHKTGTIRKQKGFVKRLMKMILVKIPIGLVLLSLLWVVALKWIPVYVTPLMVMRSIQFYGDKTFDSRKYWTPYRDISPEWARAVIASEDNLFCTHNGFDWQQIDQAIDAHKKGRRLRGASTISQQTAKNVFLLPSRSFIRKGIEAYFTVLIELIWGKERIMEVYLNVAETGKGIYGVEAASLVYFGRHANSVTRHEACLVAACLPSPLKRHPDRPTSYIASRASTIESLEYKLEYPAWIYHK